MRKIVSWLSLQKFVLFLILLVVIFQSRLTGSQWLLGWDSVVPELDWKLNFTRALAGAWQEYQGVGLTGGMAHLADLSRMTILWVINLMVPTHYVRWTWQIGMLILGPIGIWYMGKKLWKWSENACLAASLFYLLNLATVQYFFVPYEAFSSFYGYLPWLIAVFLSYLESGKRQDLGKVLLIGVLATSAFYVQTLFVVYVMTIGILSLAYLKNWKRILIGFSTVFFVNSFWLLPIMYGVIHGGGQVGLAKINSIGSPETALMNSAFGNWQNVILLKGYWLEYIEWIGGSQWGRLMQSWWAWSNQVWVMWIGRGLFGLSVIGSILQVMRGKMRWGWLAGLLLTYIMVASFSTPFGVIYKFLVDKILLFGEMFRSVFTKWSVVLALFVSIGIGNILGSLKNKWVAGAIACLMVAGSIGVVWPVFKAGMIFEKMKVELPSEYSKMFEFMQSQPKDGRVVYLPAQDMWSWKYMDWGYRGSGFLWYGIEQPILDRAFDVWSPYNEGFYNEFSTALYGGSGERVSKVLDKYDVRYVLLDESVIAPGQDKEILRIEETKRIAQELVWEQKFKEGFLTVWETTQTALQSGGQAGFISAPEAYTMAEGETVKARGDVIFADNGSYVSGMGGIQYPFANLMREEIKNVEWGEGMVRVSKQVTVDSGQGGQELVIPGWEVGEIVRVDFTENGVAIPAYTVNGQSGPVFLGEEKPVDGKSYFFAKVSEGNEWREYRESRKYVVPNEKIEIEIKGEPFVYDFAKQGQGSIGNCDVLKRGVATKNGSTYQADARGAVCDYVVMELPFTRTPYLMRVRGENYVGRSIKFFLYNTGSKRNDIEYLLGKNKFDQTFTLLPWEWDGDYTLNIETRSFGQLAENRIEPVVGQYVPLDKIARAMLVTPQQSENLRIKNDLDITYVKKTGTWLYGVGSRGTGLLRLSQGYDAGWVGLLISNHKFSNSQILEHVKVDGWANGWMVNEEGNKREDNIIVIFYWPQLLEYLGVVMLATTLLLLIRERN